MTDSSPFEHSLDDKQIANIVRRYGVLVITIDTNYPDSYWTARDGFGKTAFGLDQEQMFPAINALCEKGGYVVSSFSSDVTDSKTAQVGDQGAPTKIYVLHQPTAGGIYAPELPRRVISQPKPALHTGGDCSACVLGGLLGMATVDEVYAHFHGGTPTTFSRWEMQAAVEQAWQDELLLGIITDTPSWGVVPRAGIWGNPGSGQADKWYAYVHLAIEAGYYGIASVVYEKTGPPADSNHMVLICGARETAVPVNGGERLDQQILVSCSAAHPGGKWVGVIEFLEKWGGFCVILAKPQRGESRVKP